MRGEEPSSEKRGVSAILTAVSSEKRGKTTILTAVGKCERVVNGAILRDFSILLLAGPGETLEKCLRILATKNKDPTISEITKILEIHAQAIVASERLDLYRG